MSTRRTKATAAESTPPPKEKKTAAAEENEPSGSESGKGKAGRPRKRPRNMSEQEYRRLMAIERRENQRIIAFEKLGSDQRKVLVVLRCYFAYDFTFIAPNDPPEYLALLSRLQQTPVMDVYTGEELQFPFGLGEMVTLRKCAAAGKVPTTVLLFYLATE
jgi:hypothetical protein